MAAEALRSRRGLAPRIRLGVTLALRVPPGDLECERLLRPLGVKGRIRPRGLRVDLRLGDPLLVALGEDERPCRVAGTESLIS